MAQHGAHARAVTGRSRPGLARDAVFLSWAVLGVLTVVFAVLTVADVTVPLRWQYATYLALMIVLSLPHGGFEHVENLKGRGETFRARYLAAYVGLVALALGLFAVAPVLGFVFALAITVVKGGYGGLHVLETVAGRQHHSPGRRALAALVRGGAVMVVGFVFHPGIFQMFGSLMVGFFERGALGEHLWAFGPMARGFLGGAYGTALLAHLGLGYLETGDRGDVSGATDNGDSGTADREAWRLDAVETLLLVAYFAVVPPVIAVGVYFPFWYATRQVARLTAADRGSDTEGGTDPRPGLAAVARRVVRGGALPWLGAVALLGGVFLFAANPPTSLGGWAAFYSVVIAIIAVPHVVVGSWLDRQQGIWRTAAA